MKIELYIRSGCHLCEQMFHQLSDVLTPEQLTWVSVRDVDSRQDWFENYDTRIPVLKINGQLVCEYFLDTNRLQAILNGHDTSV